MIYDRDLRFSRHASSLLGLANVGVSVLNVVHHYWVSAATSLVWAVTCLFFMIHLRYQQQMRDAYRIAQAGLRALIERQER